jgi:Na+-transporting methylmalonyl-CoA/oxaloacetate decarboxylase gamma subunit
MAISLLIMGFIVLVISLIILTRQAIGKNIQTITKQTTKLAEKGITDNIAGLVGNATALINALNDLSKTNAGIGVFLVFLAIALLTTAYLISNTFGLTP